MQGRTCQAGLHIQGHNMHTAKEASHLGMPQYLETDGKTLWSVSAWHSSSGRQGQPWGLGTASSAVLLL